MTKKIVFIFLMALLFGLFVNTNQTLEASTDVPYSVTGIFSDGTPGAWVNQSGNATRGGNLSVTIPDNQALAFGFVNNVLTPNFNLNTYTLTSRNKIELVFFPTDEFEEATKFAVAFVDSNGELIGVRYTDTGIVTDTGLTMPEERPGFVVDSGNKWTAINGSDTLDSITNHAVFVLNYVESGTPLDLVEITTVNGTGPVAPVAFNSLVTVNADEPGVDEYFSHWSDETGIVSYNPQYKFSALYNRSLTAHMSEEPTTPEALVTLSNPLTIRDDYYTYIGQFRLLPNQELIEYGFIIHPTSAGDITIDTEGIIVAQSSNRQTSTNEFVTSFLETSHKSIRAYVYYVEEDITYIIYSDHVVNYFDYHETFENSSLTASYLDGSFVGDGDVTWIYGHSRDEESYGFDGKAIMLRRASDSYLEAIIPNGLDSLYFEFTKAFTGTAARQLEVTISYGDDESLVLLTQEFGTVDPEATIFIFNAYNLGIEGAFNIKIKNIGTTTTNRQTIVDNIKWTSFGAATGFPPEILGTEDHEILEGSSFDPLLGVSAIDKEDGDLTDSITYTVKDSENNIIDPVDFTTLTTGLYTIEYFIEDSNYNTKIIIVTLSVIESVETSLVLYKSLIGTSGSAPSGWVYFGIGSQYADGTQKMDNSGDYIITESFSLSRTATFNLKIVGKSLTNGTLTFYDQNDNLLHTAENINIGNSNLDITFTINSTSVTNVKFVFTKVTGNLGVSEVEINLIPE